MAKKKKKSRRNKGKPNSTNIKALPDAGEKLLNKGQYAEAIKIFRKLTRNTDNDRWNSQLIRAFQGRIEQLLTKGTAKEALLIYQNMVALFSNQKNNSQHILLLLQTGRLSKAAQLYGSVQLTGTDKQVVEETIAALLLSGQDNLLEQLPTDTPLRVQFSAAQDALRYYCEKKDDAALMRLREIPFRSPYKDFRLALNGMILFHTSADEARSYFGRINEKSLFYRLIVPYLSLSTDRDRENRKKISLQGADKTVTQVLQGLDNRELKFIAGLSKHDKSAQGLMLYLLSAGNCLHSKQHRNLCYRFLPQAIDCLDTFQRKFGTITDEFELLRLEALALEIENAYYYAVEAWTAASVVLVRKNKPGDARKIAMLFRHIARLMHLADQEHDFMDADRHFGIDQQRELLVKSLEYDPDDLETWEDIHKLLQNSRAKQYRWLNTMLDKFPDDPKVLLMAVEAAAARHAFKKASRLAARLLTIDPINTQVRTLLITAHLNHGYRLARKEKFALAIKECEQAETYNRNNLAKGMIAVSQGMIETLQGNDDRGSTLIAIGEEQLGLPVCTRIRTRSEAERFALPVKWKRKMDKAVAALLKKQPDKEDLLALVRENLQIVTLPATTLKSMLPWLKKGIRLNMSKEEFRAVCRLLFKIKALDLLELYGKKGVVRWPEVSVFQFYRIYGKTRAGEKRVEPKEYELLEELWHKLKRGEDDETAELIDDFLDLTGYWDVEFEGWDEGIPDWDDDFFPDEDATGELAWIDRKLQEHVAELMRRGKISDLENLEKNLNDIILQVVRAKEEDREKVLRDLLLNTLQ